mmetsp:Transcript_32278/g.84629  ORF Transcript_32278/g.84629 Transcript_32278/m.84629 type:complete len:378 (+) Transcript_32278:684-1817(+)
MLEQLRPHGAGGDELRARHPRGEARVALPSDLVLLLLGLLHLPTAVGEAFEDALLLLDDLVAALVDGVDVDDEGLLHGRLVVRRQLRRHLLDALLVRAVLVAPADVLVGRHLEVMLDVVEGVLGDVGHARVGVLPDLARALVRLELAREQLDHRRLARAVGADARGARRERHAHRDAGELRLCGAGVGEGDVGHLHDVLAFGGDALEHARRREVHLELGRLELEVGEQVRHEVLGDVREVALVLLELEVVDLEDVRADLIEHLDVVRDDDRGHRREASQVVDDPLDVARVEVVGRLVEQQDVRLHQHRARERDLHAPATRETADELLERGGGERAVGVGHVVHREADREQLLARHLLGDAVVLEPGVVGDEVEHGEL